MPKFDPASSAPAPQRILLALLLGLLALGCLAVLRPFLSAIAWAAILSYVSWPLYARLRTACRGREAPAALLMTLLMVCAVVVPLIALLVSVEDEVLSGYRRLSAYFAAGPHALPAAIRDIPWLGSQLQERLDRLSAEPDTITHALLGWLQHWAGSSSDLFANIGRYLGKLLVAIITLFFCYRDGTAVALQAQRVARRIFGQRLDPYVLVAGTMTRAVLYGFLVTASAQGLIASIGYQIVGLQAPVLLGALTGLLSAIPLFGTAAVWVPISLWLLLSGQLWQGALLLAWGMLLVHPTDNILRPLLISTATRVPFLIVMLGAIGGLAAFGMVGAFIGPVLLAVAVAIWREWAEADDKVAAQR